MPFNECARRVYQSIRADVAAAGGQLLVKGEYAVHDCPDDVQPATLNDADLVLVCETEEPQVSDSLLSLVDVNARVVAVKTDRFWAEQPLFLISIPKSGTHLLYRLAEAMGYRAAVQLQDDPAPGYWYCVEYTNSHTAARDFFVDTVRRSPFGNRHHPFMRSPAIFIYRNPWTSSRRKRSTTTATARRLLQAISAVWDQRSGCCGSSTIRGCSERRAIGSAPSFRGWDCQTSFQFLSKNLWGRAAAAMRSSSAALSGRSSSSCTCQELRIHYASQVFDPQSPTFDTGQIGRSREVFTDEAYRRFRALPQDFMQDYGYDA